MRVLARPKWPANPVFGLWIGLQVLCKSMLLVGNGGWNFLRAVDGSLATPRVIFLV